MNYYEVLQVSPAASHEVIRMAYQALQNQYHIESLQGDKKYSELKMQQLEEAYRILSSPILRQQYDRMLQTEKEQASLNAQVPLQQGHASVQKKKQIATKGKVLLMAAICILLVGALVAVLGLDKGGQEEAEPWIKNQFVADWLKNPETGEEIKKNQVLSVTFVGTLADAPENSWDISSLKKRSVLAWAIPNGNRYDVYIAAEGGVNADGRCEGMFEGFRKLERVSFNGAFHTKDVKQMSRMFKDCSSLSAVSLAGLDTSNVTDMSEMFSGCQKLIMLDLSGLKTANVTNMAGMFDHCFKLQMLNLDGFETGKVQSMGSMFAFCDSLTSLDLSGFDTSNVADMGGMFQACRHLTSLDLSGLNTSSVTDMSYMFGSCESLTELVISNFITPKVTNMSGMFEFCKGITTLDLKNFNTSNVTDMSFMFSFCDSITSLDLSGFDTSNVTNMNYMFWNCTNLTSVNLESFNTSNVTDMSGMFSEVYNLKELRLGEFDTSKVVFEGFEEGFASLDYLAGIYWRNLFKD